MAITPDDARKVARLARIGVDDRDLPTIQKELSAILAFMERLAEVDGRRGGGPFHPFAPMRLKKRADAVESGSCEDEILANAPEARQGFFRRSQGGRMKLNNRDFYNEK